MIAAASEHSEQETELHGWQQKYPHRQIASNKSRDL